MSGFSTDQADNDMNFYVLWVVVSKKSGNDVG